LYLFSPYSNQEGAIGPMHTAATVLRNQHMPRAQELLETALQTVFDC
jgi:hypothetical protein